MEKINRWNLGFVTCIECGRMFRNISESHCKSHGLTVDQYKEKYGIPNRAKLDFRNLSLRWQADVREEYKGVVRIYNFGSARIYCQTNAHVKFNLDYVSGKTWWAGKIDRLSRDKSTSIRQYPFIIDGMQLFVIKLETEQKHLIQVIGVNQIDQSYNFQSSWPEIVTDTEFSKNTSELDPRVKNILKKHDLYTDLPKRFEDCKDDREELKYLTYYDYRNNHSLRRYAKAKEIIKAYHELIALSDEHEPITVIALRNMVWFIRKEIRKHFIKEEGSYRSCTTP